MRKTEKYINIDIIFTETLTALQSYNTEQSFTKTVYFLAANRKGMRHGGQDDQMCADEGIQMCGGGQDDLMCVLMSGIQMCGGGWDDQRPNVC